MDTCTATNEKFTEEIDVDPTEMNHVAPQLLKVDNNDRELMEPTDPDMEQVDTADSDSCDTEPVKKVVKEQHLIQIVASNEEVCKLHLYH